MKGLKKVFYIFIATLMLFTLGVTAFAGNETNDGNIKIQVATDKGSYGSTGVAEITATITNVSGEDINKVTAQAVFDDLALAGKRTSETTKSVDVLKAGESFSFTYKATLNKDEHKLNIFQKIILWFVRLFNGGYNADNNNIDVVAECVTEIEFGKFTAENVVQVGYEKILTSEDNWVYTVDDEHVVITDENGNGYIDNEIILLCKPDITDNEINEIVKSVNGEIIGNYNARYQVKIETKTKEEIKRLCKELEKNDKVFAASISVTCTYSAERTDTSSSIIYTIPNDPWKDTIQGISGTDWNNNSPNGLNWGLELIEVSAAWDYNNYFNNIKIGVEDNGFDTNHEDLEIKVLNYNENSIEDHGTHVAGIIGAKANNNKGITGIVWKSELYGHDWMPTKKQEKNNIRVENSMVGIEKLLEQGVRIINLSGGNELTDNYEDIYNHGYEAAKQIAYLKYTLGYKDFLIVQAAGNRNCDSIRSGVFCSITDDTINDFINDYGFENYITTSDIYNNFIIVGAVKENDGAYQILNGKDIIHGEYNTCYGEQISIVAPGKDIFSTIKTGGTDGDYGKMSGTSMAAPIVSGVVALVWSVDDRFSSGEVKDIICKYTNKIAKGYGEDTRTYPIVNAKLAVEEAIRRTNNGFGTLNGTIKDKETTEPLKDVTVRATKDNITKTTLTDVSGVFTLELPVGDWKITLSSDTHTYDEYAAVKIEKDVDTVLQNPIYMTPKKGRVVFYSVKDSVTSEIINGVTIDIINTKTNKVVATRTTSDIGSPFCVLPYGTYDIVFQHDAYETYRETIVIGYGEKTIKNIKLQPKDSNSIGTVTGTVTNGNLMYSPPIYGVKVRAVDNNGKVTATTTDEYGRYTLKLPYGSYSISFDCDYYEHYDMQLTVSGNKYTRNIKLNPYDSYYICSVLIPSVKDSITNESICNVAVEVKSDDTNQIIKTMIISDGTSNPFHLPRGMYSITFIHEDYEDTCVNVHISGDICSLQTIYLTPQENFVTASGECGADGDNVTWTLYEDGELVISGSGAMTDYDDYYSNAPWFRYNSNITKVIIKNGITRIGYRAFYDCANIQSVVMGDSVTSIGEMAFCFCQSITNLVIPNGVKTIEGSAFASCTNLTNVTIGNNVTSICDFAFYGCINLSNITIPNSVTTIGAGAFYSCWNLKSIVIPNSVTTIGKETFRGCRSLISVTIPNSITSIEEEAFYSCESLNSITIPDNVTSIGRNSFSNCYKLTDVYYKGSATQWKKIDISIYGNDYLTNATIHYNA